MYARAHTHTRLMALYPGLPGWAGTRKVKPIWILLKQETVSGSEIHWAVCKSALRSRQITTPAPHHSVFYRPDALPAAQPTASKHWRQCYVCSACKKWTCLSICLYVPYARPQFSAVFCRSNLACGLLILCSWLWDGLQRDRATPRREQLARRRCSDRIFAEGPRESTNRKTVISIDLLK